MASNPNKYNSITTHDLPSAVYIALTTEEFVAIDDALSEKGSLSDQPNPCDRARLNLMHISERDGDLIMCRDAHVRAAFTALAPNGEEAFAASNPEVWRVLTRQGRRRVSGPVVAALREHRLLGGDEQALAATLADLEQRFPARDY